MRSWWGWLLCTVFSSHEWNALRGWTGRVVVYACIHCGELRTVTHPGHGQEDGVSAQ